MSIVIAVLALGLLIFVHELGHFLVAKKCGVKVERFSLGFGPSLWSRKWGETEYIVAVIPLGGYVKMHGDVPEEWEERAGMAVENMGRQSKEEREPIDPERSFLHKPIPQRLAIAFAGPAFNLVFGYVAILLFLWVQPQPSSLIGMVEEGSAAAEAGIQNGDRIVGIDGEEIEFFEDLSKAIDEAGGGELLLRVERGGEVREVTLTPRFEDGVNEFGEPAQVPSIGLGWALGTRIEAVASDGAAAEAGLKAGDEIVALDGAPVRFWSEVSRTIREKGERPVKVDVMREGERLSFAVTPRLAEIEVGGEKQQRALIGIQGSQEFVETRAAGFGYAFAKAPAETWRLIVLIPTGLYKLVVGAVPRDQIGGPIEIGAQIARAAERGFGQFLFLLALISINLGILNLLPIPVLDGGHIAFFLVEAINRRPVSVRAREIAQQVGLVLLLLLMLYAFFNDLRRHVPGLFQLFGLS